MTDSDEPAQPKDVRKNTIALDDKFPDGTSDEDRVCWVCKGDTAYRNCKIICKNCGFTRDCSDP
jgi:hypothetical protein